MKTFNARVEMKPECGICSVLKHSVRFGFLSLQIGLIMVSKRGAGGLQVSRALERSGPGLGCCQEAL